MMDMWPFVGEPVERLYRVASLSMLVVGTFVFVYAWLSR